MHLDDTPNIQSLRLRLECTRSPPRIVILFVGKCIKWINSVKAQRAPKGPNCLEQLHLGSPPTHPLPVGLGHHLSSGLGLALSLNHGAGVFVSSSASWLDCRPVLLVACLLAGPWTCVIALSLAHLLLLLAGAWAWSILSAFLSLLVDHVAIPGSACHVQTCGRVLWVRALGSWVTLPKKGEMKLVKDPGDKLHGAAGRFAL